MRSRARLIEVLASVNDNAGAFGTRQAAFCLGGTTRDCRLCCVNMEALVDSHPSPHIRELAAEALHYLKGGSDGREINAELMAALKEARDYVRGDLKNIGPCEHDVGHCVCGIRSMLHNMEEAITKAEGKL